MKKYLFILSLIIIFANPSYSDELEDMSNVPDIIFRSSLTNIIPDVTSTSASDYQYAFDDYGRTYSDIDSDSMPFFKQMRLKAGNAIYKRSINADKGEKESFLHKIKFRLKKNKTNINSIQADFTSENDIANSIRTEVATDIPEDAVQLEGGVNTEVTEKQMVLDAVNVNFDEETGDMLATGRPSLFLPPQNIKVIADTMTYNEDSNILKGIGNVVVIKDSMPSTGSYLEVDINEETVIMDDVVSASPTMNMTSQRAVQKDGLLILNKGNFYSDESQVYRLMSRMIGPRFQNMIVDEDAKALFFGDPTGNKMTMDIDSIYVDARKNHDVFKAKGIKISRDGKTFLKWPRITAYTNKDRDYFEASYPEFGTMRKLGMFAGPGFVFGGPAGSVIKVIPFINYNHKFGFGGALKYMNTFNRTELGYGTSNDIFFLKGLQRLDDNLFLQYASNTYTDEWFLGRRMAKYMAEVFYDKRYVKKDFLAPNMTLQFRHRIGFGFMEDNDRNFYGEKIRSNEISSTRTRYMAEIQQNFYSYANEERRISLNAGISMQGSAALYGTGDTQFIARVGPRLHIQYKNWMQDVGYFLAGYSGNSPMPRYDMYRYGHQSVYLTEAFRLNKYLSVGWAGNINLSDDSPNGKMFQENAFLVSIGPDDLKITLGYDFVRQTTYFGFNVAFDTKGTKINYGKMEIKNPERLGKNKKDKNAHQVAFTPVAAKSEQTDAAQLQDGEEKAISLRKPKSKAQHRVLEYAQVIEIEDPDKETIQ